MRPGVVERMKFKTLDLSIQDIEIDIEECRLKFKTMFLGKIELNNIYINITPKEMIEILKNVIEQYKELEE
jgi:hypothetical protein